MVKNTTITLAAMSLLACNPVEFFSGEPEDHYYLVGKAHRNAGPYVWDTEISLSDPSAVDQITYVRSADASVDKSKALRQIREASEYITTSLNELGQNDCVDESIVKVYFVPKKTLNDPKKMAFVTEESAFEENEFFGLTTMMTPFPITSSFICSDCEESKREALIVHELSHAWLTLCGDFELMKGEDIPEMLEEDYFRNSF